MITDKTKCIVSFTSYGERLSILPIAIKKIIGLPEFHLVFTVYKGDEDKITPQTKKWIDDGLIELFIDDIDYRYHKKYMHAMEKYGEKYPIIIIDDDCVYMPMLLNRLYREYEKTPNYVIGTRGYIPVFDSEGEPVNVDKWNYIRDTYEGNDLILFGGFGVIYPPGFKPLYDFFPNYNFNDDFTLCASALKQGLNIRLVKCYVRPIRCPIASDTATWKVRFASGEDVDYFNFYRDIFIGNKNNESLCNNDQK